MDTYTHGHHHSVLAHHASRTVANSAAFLVPYLEPGQRMLDVGCGPGSITIELAGLVAPGAVHGIDVVPDVLDRARAVADRAGVDTVSFSTGDVYALDFDDHTIDVVYAHQVLQHLTEPVAALTEMRRVTAPGGIVAVRDADYGAFVWAPEHPLLTRWLELYHEVTRRNNAEADAGRHLAGWMDKAGFDDVVLTTSNWHYADAPGTAWWANGWHQRSTESAFATQAIEYGLATAGELSEIADTWTWWRDQPNAFFLIPHVEAVARTSS